MYYMLCDGRDREIKFTSFHGDEIIVLLPDSELVDDSSNSCSMETVWNNYGKGCEGGTLRIGTSLIKLINRCRVKIIKIMTKKMLTADFWRLYAPKICSEL